ncbi:hypothetical protein N7471_010776 [Penicillium samsonianum]|uniref:uncharacterized protein n=1 Tax=Penicillium samsonianum TaxID=1882272 RepID=UPI002547B952|nr:uncharacterized protein N7471_010776 [Penicillium samsonianum]KAJ6126283.1 hypothetical protein N7471_010776 [Penicillium samsonianum]
MAPLINRITNALADATALERLLPEILSSDSPDGYLGNAFVRAAAAGYIESYKLTASEVFKHPERNCEKIERAITCAIQQHQDWIANDLLHRILSSLRGLDRENILHFALMSAARENNIIISKHILKEEFSIRFYDAPLTIACGADRPELVSLMVESLMKNKSEDASTAAIILRVDEGNRAVLNSVKKNRGRVLESALEQSTKRKFHSTIAVLLVPYLECVMHYSLRRDHDTARKILKQIDNEDYAHISRESSISLLSTNIPSEAKRSILRRLEPNLDNEPKDICLSVEEQHLWAHKDVLSFWSPYFTALFHGEWADRDHVSFDKDIISAAALKYVVDFAYSGEFVNRGLDVSPEEKIHQLEDLQAAADYLNIDALKKQIEECLGLE